MKNLILASSSKRRKELLKQIGITNFAIKPACLDETMIYGEKPRVYALRMALSKAQEIAKTMKEDDLILASDTVVAVGKRILPKTEDADTARKCLELISGRRHTVLSGLCLISSSNIHKKVIKTVVKFKNLSKIDIDDYIASNQWKGVAGGYKIQGLAAKYISFLSGSYTNVVGMDVHTVSKWLEKYGY